MARFEQIRDRLHSLYRPEDGDTGLLTQFIRAVADALARVDLSATLVLQSHWYAYADRALYSPFFLRGRQLQDPQAPLPLAGDPELAQFPYIRDLARIAALLSVPPWEEPPALRELVEAYRLRISRIVALYRNGLGTLDALRRMIEAQLPVDLAAPAPLRDRPFWLEEHAPLGRATLAVQARGEPLDMVGPLMRWTLLNDGLRPVAPTLYIQGVEPQPGEVDATAQPVIELYQAGSSLPRLGIGYRDTIAPGETLRLRPAYASWIGLDGGIQRAESLPTEETSADPTAPGPWASVEGAPSVTVVAVLQAHDRSLWAAADNAGVSEVWRFDGQAWTQALSGLAQLHAMAEDRQGQRLLIGTGDGLLSVPLYPESGVFAASATGGLSGTTVFSVYQAADGQWWLGTSSGLLRLDPSSGDSATPFVLGQEEATAIEVYAISQDGEGTLYFGTELGLFLFQPASGHWYWYEGERRTEQAPDWQRLLPEASGEERNFPEESRVFLPPVRCVHRGPDASLWIGTESGLARYVAQSARGLTFDTLLEAFPDLVPGRVFAIAGDERGLVWFCTDHGLFRYDGRDFWQHRAGAWVPLGRADTLYGDTVEPRGAWRFQRATSQWQRFDPGAEVWTSFAGEPRSTEEPTVRAVAWSDSIVADLGQWDGATFTSVSLVDASDLVVRFKPAETRIVDGGIPSVPRLPVGISVWRYLSLEPAEILEPVDRPAWTMEGRLLPPPPELAAPGEGRYDVVAPPPESNFDEAVFAFNPAARVWYAWEPRKQRSVLARLKKRADTEHIDPAIIDRVWQGMQQVRPAGVSIALAVEEQTVRGGNNG